MGEAKQREEAGKEGPAKIYGEGDACPVCGKTCKGMDAEHDGKLITLAGGAFIVCWRCGAIFFPKSRIKFLADAATKTIIDPNSPVGQQTQVAASKIVLPGAK
jgi:hypothetical protein